MLNVERPFAWHFRRKRLLKKYKNKTLSPAGKTVREPPVCLKIHHVIPCPTPHPEPAVCWLLERKSESKMKNHKGSPKQHRWQREKLSLPPSNTSFKSNTQGLTRNNFFFFPWENLLKTHSDSEAPRVRELWERHGIGWEDAMSSPPALCCVSALKLTGSAGVS